MASIMLIEALSPGVYTECNLMRKPKQGRSSLRKAVEKSDFRNVSSLSEEAYQQFVEAYNLLYFREHGGERAMAEQEEARIDGVASPLFELISAFGQEQFPDWASEAKQAALDGTLLNKAKRLLL